MEQLKEQLKGLELEFFSFNIELLNEIRNIKSYKTIYSSDYIENLEAFYYEIGDYRKPNIYKSKPKGEDYVITHYDKNNKLIKSVRYNFNNILLNELYYLQDIKHIKCYELINNKLEKLEVLILEKNQKKEYYRYSTNSVVSTGILYNYENEKITSIKAYTESYIGEQNTEYRILYVNDIVSEIIRFDEKSNIFPNGQKLSIFKKRKSK
jgi:hypothetical protein